MTFTKSKIAQIAHICALFDPFFQKLDIIWQLLCKTVISSKFVQVVVNPAQSQQLLQAKIVGFYHKMMSKMS